MTDHDPTIRIEHFPDGSDDAPLILIWGYDIQATRDLFHSIRALRDGREQEIAIHRLPHFEGVGGLELFARMSEISDHGPKCRNGLIFDWRLSDEEWQQVEDLLAPFCDRYAAPGPHQWLNNSRGISVIFSTGRGW